eukprot:TRINITY_DN4595_c0_g1_i1.p1 TRINITY_DN4595_c0_g1~~TRINITY_DN4595_c0_g1_i1.p1  ORF type:complete len:231 (-),score=28.73 TRINITY_DN4595_c0_g1_i1:391-1083(-)
MTSRYLRLCLGVIFLQSLLLSGCEAQATTTNVIESIVSSIPMYDLQFSESFLRPFYFNSSKIVIAAIIGNFLVVGLVFYFFGFLPENRIGGASNRRAPGDDYYVDEEDEYYDDYFYDEFRRSLQKRSVFSPEVKDISEDYEAEDRATRARNLLDGLTHLFTYPMSRMGQGFSDLYRMYENYWRGVVGSNAGQFQKRRRIQSHKKQERKGPKRPQRLSRLPVLKKRKLRPL